MPRILNNSTCCGLTEIDTFHEGITSKEIQDLLPGTRTMVIATVNQHQPKARKALIAAGFRTLKRFRNRNSSNLVYLMGYDKSSQ